MRDQIDNQTVYVLQHVRYSREGDPWAEENVKLIGIYRTEELARAAILRLVKQPGFCKYPRLIDPSVEPYCSGFNLDKYRLDEDNWAEGFGFDGPPSETRFSN